MEIYLSTSARTSYPNRKEVVKVQNCDVSHIQIQTTRKRLLAAYRQTTTSASQNLPTLKLGLASSSDNIMVPFEGVARFPLYTIYKICRPCTEATESRVLAFVVQPTWASRWVKRERDVDGLTPCMLASKEKVESKQVHNLINLVYLHTLTFIQTLGELCLG